MSHSTTSGGVRRVRARKRERRGGARGAHRAAQRRAEIDARAPVVGARAAHRHFRQRQAQARDHALDLRELVGGHRREVVRLQHLARRERERRVELGRVVLVACRRVARRRHRLGQARGHLRPLLGAGAAFRTR
jgi:hypothetical protein